MSDERSLARQILAPPFLAGVVILVVAAFGMNGAVSAISDRFSKSPIELRQKFDHFDVDALPSWQIVDHDSHMTMAPGDVETEDTIDLMLEPIEGTRERVPFDDMLLFLTYYNDPRDQIPHTPEVCYRQAGNIVWNIETVEIETPDIPGLPRIEGRLLDIDQHGKPCLLIYVLVHNGRVYHDRERVRFAMGWPGDKYSFFSKVEVATFMSDPDERDLAVARCKSLLAESLAELMRSHFPSREDVAR